MTLTARERVLRTLRHEPVDRLPTQVNYTTTMGQRMSEHFGVSAEVLPARLGNHLVRVGLTYEPRLSADGKARYDWWGAGHDTQEEGYYIREAPLSERRDLDGFDSPDPRAPGLLLDAVRVRAATGDEAFVIPDLVGRSSSEPGRCAASRTRSWSSPPTPPTWVS